MRTALQEEEPGTCDAAETRWHPGSILVFFFAASLISAVVFGLGYSFGRRGTARAEMSYGSVPAEGAVPASRQASGAVAMRPASTVRRHRSSGSTVADAHGEIAGRGGRFMVQVGAVGSRREARKLVTKLRKSGFQAEVYPGRHDRYLHVQIGPFRTPEEAARMRRRVMARG